MVLQGQVPTAHNYQGLSFCSEICSQSKRHEQCTHYRRSYSGIAVEGGSSYGNAKFSKQQYQKSGNVPNVASSRPQNFTYNLDNLTKQVVFTACTTGFYASTRMGEILASREFSHAPLSDLTWADVKESSDTSLLLRLKQPKSGEQAEFVDLFPFPGYQCCPVASIRELKALQQKEACFDLDKPVFRFKNGRNLTQTNLNAILGNLLQDLCKPGENSVSCHSFRAGIPSTLSLFPHLVTDDMIKGWGRWHSDCYQKYMRLKLPQKEKIFEKIAGALQTTLPGGDHP